jgi:hypothetical protein
MTAGQAQRQGCGLGLKPATSEARRAVPVAPMPSEEGVIFSRIAPFPLCRDDSGVPGVDWQSPVPSLLRGRPSSPVARTGES